MKNYHYTEDQKIEVVRLRKEGLTYKTIAEKTGIRNQSTISQLCKKANFPITPSPKNKYEIGQRHKNFVISGIVSQYRTDIGLIYSRWKCLCDCGQEFIVTTKQIKRGQKSCGCHKLDSMFRRSLTDQQANIRRLIQQYKRSAKTRELSWELNEEQASNLFLSNCYYCNTSPSRIENRLDHCTPLLVSGIDRKNNDIGYLLHNCVSCCKFCNRAKLNASMEEFENWAKNFVQNFGSSGSRKA